MKIKVTQGDEETIIDNVIGIEQFIGNRDVVTDFCGGLLGICPDCIKRKNKKCGRPFIVGYMQGDPAELSVETPEKDYIFIGDDVEYEVMKMRHNRRKYSKRTNRTHPENLTADEHKLICYLRNKKRRAMGQPVEFRVVVNSGIRINEIKSL